MTRIPGRKETQIAKLGGVPAMSQSDFLCIGWRLLITINRLHHLTPYHVTRELMEYQR